MKDVDIVVGLSEFTAKKNFEPATLVKTEDSTEFLRVLPLEIQPKLDEATYHYGMVYRHVAKTMVHYLAVGYHLFELKRTEVYRYVRDEGEKGYESFYKFCKDKFNMSPTNVKRHLAVCAKFCAGGPVLTDTYYEQFSFRKLAEMATFERDLEHKFTASVTVEQLKELRTYYSKNNWRVSTKTRWQDDWKACQEEKERDRKRKQELKKGFVFESIRDEQERKGLLPAPADAVKPQKNSFRYHTDLDKLMSFFDNTCRSVAELKKKFPSFADDLDEVYEYLQGKSQALHRAKYDDVLGRL